MSKGNELQKNTPQREHIIELYKQLMHSVREAQSVQNLVEKEQQMRRLMRYLRGNRQFTT